MEMALTKDQFMDLVLEDIEKRKRKKIEEKKRKEREYMEFKIHQSSKYGSKYTKRKNIRR